jgi:hypothetical protein
MTTSGSDPGRIIRRIAKADIRIAKAESSLTTSGSTGGRLCWLIGWFELFGGHPPNWSGQTLAQRSSFLNRLKFELTDYHFTVYLLMSRNEILKADPPSITVRLTGSPDQNLTTDTGAQHSALFMRLINEAARRQTQAVVDLPEEAKGAHTIFIAFLKTHKHAVEDIHLWDLLYLGIWSETPLVQDAVQARVSKLTTTSLLQGLSELTKSPRSQRTDVIEAALDAKDPGTILKELSLDDIAGLSPAIAFRILSRVYSKIEPTNRGRTSDEGEDKGRAAKGDRQFFANFVFSLLIKVKKAPEWLSPFGRLFNPSQLTKSNQEELALWADADLDQLHFTVSDFKTVFKWVMPSDRRALAALETPKRLSSVKRDLGDSGLCYFAGYLFASHETCLMAGMIDQNTAVIPEGVTKIGDEAYKEQTELTSVVPFGLRNMTVGASTTATIPCAITEIGDSAFEGCTGIKALQFQPDAKLELIGENAFANSGLFSISLCEPLRTIGPGAFFRCLIRLICFPKSLQVIDDDAFEECAKLEGIQFEEGSELKRIGEGSFADCYKLIKFPARGTKLQSLSDNAFENSGLEVLELPYTMRDHDTKELLRISGKLTRIVIDGIPDSSGPPERPSRDGRTRSHNHVRDRRGTVERAAIPAPAAAPEQMAEAQPESTGGGSVETSTHQPA